MAIRMTQPERSDTELKDIIMSDSKEHKSSSAVTKLRIHKRQTGFEPTEKPSKDHVSKKDRELDEPNEPDSHDGDDKPKKSKNDAPEDRELDEKVKKDKKD